MRRGPGLTPPPPFPKGFMKQWEVVTWAFPEGTHPAVIVTPDRWAGNPDVAEVNVLLCSSQRATRLAGPHEIILDEADGLDWPTLCKCHFLYVAPKSELKQRRGTVTKERRRELGRILIRLFGLWSD